MYLTTWKELFTNKLLSGMLTLNSHSEKGCWKKGQNCMQQSQKVIWVSSNERILISQTIRYINSSKLVTPSPYSEVFSDFPEILKLRTPALKTAHNTYWKSVACTFTLFSKNLSWDTCIQQDWVSPVVSSHQKTGCANPLNNLRVALTFSFWSFQSSSEDNVDWLCITM